MDEPREFADGEFDDPEEGMFDTETVVNCPHCGESVEVILDPGGGAHQDYVEDCTVCCRPWQVCVRYDSSGAVSVTLAPQ